MGYMTVLLKLERTLEGDMIVEGMCSLASGKLLELGSAWNGLPAIGSQKMKTDRAAWEQKVAR